MGPLLPVRCLAQRDAYVIYTELIGRPFIKRFALRYRTVVCLSCLSVCDVGVLWQNAWMDQDDTRYGGRPRPIRHCVRWGPGFLAPKRTQPRNFRVMSVVPMSVVAKRLDGSRCHLVGR